MSGYKYPGKNSRVSIYREKRKKVKAEGRDSFATERQYLIHPKGKPIRAYCNPIVGDVSSHDTAQFPNERILVVINYHEDVRVGDIVEWGRKRMRILLPPDDYEGRHLELKLTCETLEAEP